MNFFLFYVLLHISFLSDFSIGHGNGCANNIIIY